MLLRSRLGSWLRHALDGTRPGDLRPTSRQAGQDEPDAASVQFCPAVGLPDFSAEQRVAELRAHLKEFPRDNIGNYIYPAALDEIPDWVLMIDEIALMYGESPYRYPTRRSFAAAIAACEATLARQAEQAPRLAPALSPHDAARKFLAWMRETGRCGQYSDGTLKDAYELHCQMIGAVPASDAHVRKHLRQLGGVSKALGKGPSTNKRERPTIWTIMPSLSIASQRPAKPVAHVARKQDFAMAA